MNEAYDRKGRRRKQLRRMAREAYQGKAVELDGLTRQDIADLLVELGGHEQRIEGEKGDSERSEQEGGTHQAAYEKLEEFLEVLLSSTPHLLAYMDKGFNFIRVNKAYAEAGGRSTEDFIGKNHFELYPHEENKEIFRQVVATGRSFYVQAKPFVHPDQPERGTTYWDWSLIPVKGESGQVQYLILSLYDVTDRKRFEKALQESKEKFSKVFFESPSFMLITELEDGSIVEVNKAYCQLTGYSREELVGKRPVDLGIFALEDRKEGIEQLREKGAIHNQEQLRWTRDGEVRSVILFAELIELEGRERIISMGVDITERKRAEEKLRQAKEEAERANRHKSDFIAKMSHEIRTPMNTVLGMIRLALRNELAPEQHSRLEVARDSAESLLWLLNDLLDLSRIEAGEFVLHDKEFDLGQLLQNVVAENVWLAKNKGLKFEFEAEDGLPESVRSDPHRIRQVLVNLINNALKFTCEGGIKVSAKSSPGNGASDDVCWMTFSVEDSGPGIAAEQLEAIFSRYTQLDGEAAAKGLGTGLGLTICHRIVEQLGGTIWVESCKEKGSTFAFRVPLQRGSSRKASGSSKAEAKPAELPPLRILLVEDERMNQIFSVDLLEGEGHAVEVAENGQQALERLKAESFDVVLMDIKMPVMDGLTATERIRMADSLYLDPEVPVIGLSAHAMASSEAERHRRAGMDAFVTKPVEFELLFSTMKRVLEQKKRLGLQSGKS